MEAQEKMTLDSITIDNMMEEIFKTQSVKKKRKDIVAHYQAMMVDDLFGGGSGITAEEVAKKVDSVLKTDRNANDPYLAYSKQYYRKAKGRGKPVDPLPMPDTNYIGKGGECVVMGELLFRGYNVNNMMVDEGIDIVASKDNVFYYIQVKTRYVDEANRFRFSVKKGSFDKFVGTQMRYILVARCQINKEIRNIFFKFSNDDIQRFIHQNVIPLPTEDVNTLSIKIEFDTRTGKAYMYDRDKYREDVTFYMNNFNL